jgi:hypothetical protein
VQRVNTKVLMTASAIALGTAGAAGLFLPEELLAALGIAATGMLPTLVQLHAAALLGFAMVNWMAKDSLIGGIYNRPVAVGNVMHFATGAITLMKVAAANATPIVITAMVLYAVFGVAFGMLLFRSPRAAT